MSLYEQNLRELFDKFYYNKDDIDDMEFVTYTDLTLMLNQAFLEMGGESDE